MKAQGMVFEMGMLSKLNKTCEELFLDIDISTNEGMAKGRVGRFRRAKARGQLENILNLTDHVGDGS